MKTRFILLLILLAVIALVVINLLPETQTTQEKIVPEKESYRTLLLNEVELKGEQTVEGKLTSSVTKKIRFEVGGLLEKGDVSLKAGQEFRFNQLLMKVNMKEMFVPISDLKSSMEQTLKDLLPEIATRFPNETAKWKGFLSELDPARRLPAFPLLASKEEGDLLRSTRFLKDYVKAAKLEEEVEKYFYMAPYDGTVISVSKRPGSLVKPGEAVGVIAKKGSFSVQMDTSLRSKLSGSGEIEFLNSEGQVIGSGKFRSKQGAYALYSFSSKGEQPKDGKVYVKISNGVNCFRIPASSMKENKVKILSGGTVSEREITVLKAEGDSLYISGVKDGEVLILP